jgi:hypothetical protein
MDNISGEKAFLIFIFNMLVPTLDQYMDMNMVIRLFRGPAVQVEISGGKWLPRHEESSNPSHHMFCGIQNYCKLSLKQNVLQQMFNVN